MRLPFYISGVEVVSGFQEKLMNYITLQATEFVNYPQRTVTFGFRMYDWDGKVYDNTWEEIPDDDLDILRKVCRELPENAVPLSDDEVITAMLDFIWENKTGIYIGDIWYDWEDIKDIITQTQDRLSGV